jgi:prepilin-type processing-associated H-X9-DG protein
MKNKWNYVCILAILAGLYVLIVPSCAMVRERGRRTSCHNYMKQKGLAFNLYAADHNEAQPTNVLELSRYIGGDSNVRVFFCPSRIRHLSRPAPQLISQLKDFPAYQCFDYLQSTSSVQGIRVHATITPIMCDKPENHDHEGITILFADGHVGWWEGTIEDYGRSNNLVITVRTDWVK